MQAANPTFGGHYSLEWLSPKGAVIEIRSWNAEAGFWARHKFTSAGTYTLVVNPEGTATGSVDLTLWDATVLISGTITPTEEGESKTFSIGVPGQVRGITFEGTEGEHVLLNLSEIGFGGFVAIHTPGESGISGGEGSLSKGGSLLLEPVTLPATGTYTVFFLANGNETGSVKFTAYKPAADLTGSITPTTEGAEKAVSLGVGQNARYSVTAKAGEEVSLETSSGSFSGNYRLEWRDSEGNYIDSNSWSGSSSGYWNRHKFTSAGTYTLVVNPEGTATGSVDLTLWDATVLISGTITPTEEGESKTFSIGVPGQVRGITFEGTEGEHVLLNLSEIGFGGFVAIHTPGESGISGGEGSLSKGGSLLLEPVTLPATGTYTVFFLANGNETGSVKFTAYLDGEVAFRSPRVSPSLQYALFEVAQADSAPASFAAYNPNSVEPERQDARDSQLPNAQPGLARPIAVDGESPQDGSRSRSAVGGHQRASAQSSQLPWTFRASTARLWLPPRSSHGKQGWVTGAPDTPWTEVHQLQAPKGETALSGQVLEQDGMPLQGIKVTLDGLDTVAKTDRAGRFLLSEVPSGRQILVVDGNSRRHSKRYGTYEMAVDIANHETTTLEYTVWLTELDPQGTHAISPAAKHEITLTNSKIPGLEVKLPAGTVIRNAAGHVIKSLNLTAIPVDRTPSLLPAFQTIPLYYTIQPGRAYLSKGARIIYPNWTHLPPGERVSFWNYDASDRGWYIYGHGSVSADGTQIMPDPGVRVWKLSGAMISGTPTPPGTAPTGVSGGDPVDFYSGLFTYHKRDLVLPDTIPITIERTYRQNDSNSYSFGKGIQSLYNMELWSINNYHETDLILPDGRRVHYDRISPGTGWEDAVYRSENLPGPFFGSTITWDPGEPGWELELTSGLIYVFGEVAPLQAIRNPQGEELKLTRESGQSGNITKITSPHGRWAKFTYDGSNRITKITDNGGQQLEYAYTEGLLTSATDPAGHITKYAYNPAGEMTSITNPRNKKYLQTAYAANGRVKKQTAADGAVFEFEYDLDEAGKAEAATLTDPRGNKKEVQFNSEGLALAETLAPETEYEETTTYERQAKTGLLLSMKDQLERLTTYEYDSNGNPTEETKLAGTKDAETWRRACHRRN